MPPPELLLSDLVRDSKIETEVLASCIQHIFFESGPSVRERHVRREERWVRQSFLGQGAYGTVYLEKCEHGREGKLRAVKEIKKFVVQGQELDYVRELEAIVKFSHPKVSTSVGSSKLIYLHMLTWVVLALLCTFGWMVRAGRFCLHCNGVPRTGGSTEAPDKPSSGTRGTANHIAGVRRTRIHA